MRSCLNRHDGGCVFFGSITLYRSAIHPAAGTAGLLARLYRIAQLHVLPPADSRTSASGTVTESREGLPEAGRFDTFGLVAR